MCLSAKGKLEKEGRPFFCRNKPKRFIGLYNATQLSRSVLNVAVDFADGLFFLNKEFFSKEETTRL